MLIVLEDAPQNLALAFYTDDEDVVCDHDVLAGNENDPIKADEEIEVIELILLKDRVEDQYSQANRVQE